MDTVFLVLLHGVVNITIPYFPVKILPEWSLKITVSLSKILTNIQDVYGSTTEVTGKLVF